MNNPPFTPIKFQPGPPTTPAWESGPQPYAAYNGYGQTSQINTAKPSPAYQTLPGGMAGGGVLAPPVIVPPGTKSTARAPLGTQGLPSAPGVMPQSGPQLRIYLGADGKTYAFDPATGISYPI